MLWLIVKVQRQFRFKKEVHRREWGATSSGSGEVPPVSAVDGGSECAQCAALVRMLAAACVGRCEIDERARAVGTRGGGEDGGALARDAKRAAGTRPKIHRGTRIDPVAPAACRGERRRRPAGETVR